MAYDGVILYGPPASGKDTVTAELIKLAAVYGRYPTLKFGDGRQVGYRPVTNAELEMLRQRGSVVYESQRYGATYVIERGSLNAAFEAGSVPIVHIGRVAGVEALCAEGRRWLTVLLWCPRGVSEARLRERGQIDVAGRLAVWDETADDLSDGHRAEFSLAVRTDRLSALAVAQIIDDARTG